MVILGQADFEGYVCSTLENESLKIWITREVGPRVIGLSLMGGDSLLAVLPDAKIVLEGSQDFSLRGGHRLWYAPENPETTYIADDHPVEISEIEDGVELEQVVDLKTGIQKSWKVILDDRKAMLRIVHKLTNQGEHLFMLAPWAITQLKPGGTAVLPLQLDRADEYGLLPNRQIVFWPYTKLNSPYLHLNDKSIIVEANISQGALKVGAPNPIGWLAYELGGYLFVKEAEYQAGSHYLDRGASSQIYCDPGVIELETLGPAVELAPGESVEHEETWRIYPEGSWPEEISQFYISSDR